MLRYAWLALAFMVATLLPSAVLADTLDGRWQGTIHFDKEAFLVESSTPSAGADFRIEIDDSVVRVFAKNDGQFVEAKEGTFHIARVATNAVVYSNMAPPPSDGWAETWAFVITTKDEDNLIVQFVRVVNNRGLPASNPDGRFATRGIGEFKRLK